MDCLPQLHVAAYHAEAHYRNDVPGLGVLCNSASNFLGAGVYSNSIGKQSEYITFGKYLYKQEYLKFGIVSGLVTGYRPETLPMLGAVVSYKHLHLFAIPPVEGVTPFTVQLSLTIPIE